MSRAIASLPARSPYPHRSMASIAQPSSSQVSSGVARLGTSTFWLKTQRWVNSWARVPKTVWAGCSKSRLVRKMTFFWLVWARGPVADGDSRSRLQK
ncbi:hypothetical protein D3C86_1164290 [compost metagenome]